MADELDRKRQRLETTPGGGKIPAPLEGDPIRRGPEHGFREGAGGNQPPSRDTRPGRATRFLETTLGTLSYSELAPILAERVLRVEARIAEGRFLTIHPFTDFNGRTIRLFLLELLRRFDLPRVVLAPDTNVDRKAYFEALESADHADWHPLTAIWESRLANSNL